MLHLHRLHRLWRALTTIAPCDTIDPPSAEDRAAKARADQGKRRRHHGLSEVMRVSQAEAAEVIDLAERRKQLDSIVSYRRPQ